jgi:RsiW-degrading membrane proteinase PrsW (M82 family)
LLENMFLAGDATGAALIGFLSGVWNLTWALALIPGSVTIVAGAVFAWQYGVARSRHPAAEDGRA